MRDATSGVREANSSQLEWPDRYSRQVAFAPIGTRGQRRLGSSTVLIVGCGALGASLAQHMVRAGVGRVVIADRDYIEPSNLQRQVLFDESDARAALPKAAAAADKLKRINSDIQIEAHVTHVGIDNVWALAEGADLVLDGTDNAGTRLLLSDVCFQSGIPFAYGGVVGSTGMSALLLPGTTACLRCLIGGEEAAGETESCDTAGVLSPAVEFVASLQAAEALKWLSGNGSQARKTWLSADLWSFRLREADLPGPSAGCLHCAPGRTWQQPEGWDGRSDFRVAGHVPPVVLCGRNSVQVTLGASPSIEQAEAALEANLSMEHVQTAGDAVIPLEQGQTSRAEGGGCKLIRNRYLLKAEWRNGETLVYFPDGRVLVQGTTDIDRALELCKMLYSQESLAQKSHKH
ncbi:ThiF family adenylyltransferase [Paenibacillus sp. CAU 1782]